MKECGEEYEIRFVRQLHLRDRDYAVGIIDISCFQRLRNFNTKFFVIFTFKTRNEISL